MKSLIKATTLTLLTVTSLSLSLTNKAQAFTNQSINPIEIKNETIYNPSSEIETNQVKTSQSEMVAYDMYCETTTYNDGSVEACCVDSDGNWACVY